MGAAWFLRSSGAINHGTAASLIILLSLLLRLLLLSSLLLTFAICRLFLLLSADDNSGEVLLE